MLTDESTAARWSGLADEPCARPACECRPGRDHLCRGQCGDVELQCQPPHRRPVERVEPFGCSTTAGSDGADGGSLTRQRPRRVGEWRSNRRADENDRRRPTVVSPSATRARLLDDPSLLSVSLADASVGI